MTGVDVVTLGLQVLAVAVLTGLVTYALMVLASRHPWLQMVVLVTGLVYGAVAGWTVVLMELVVNG